MFDAQKDMALAMLGLIACGSVQALRNRGSLDWQARADTINLE